ncbi:MAG TPA: hypothetical protein VN614_01915 [Rhodanobacter sp.]|nr:hypothetical protein [Rhodanobacter sp.]
MNSTQRHFLLCCGVLLLLLGAPAGHAKVLVKADVLQAPGVSLRSVSAALSDRADGGIQLRLHVARGDVAAVGWRRVSIDLDGVLEHNPRQQWVYTGKVKLGSTPGGELSNANATLVADQPANTLRLELRQDRTQASAWLPLDQPSHAQVVVKNLPATWLRGLLGTLGAAQTSAGEVDADLSLDVLEHGLRSSGQFALRGMALDTPTGNLATQNLGASGRFDVDNNATSSQVTLDANLKGGEILLAPLYAQLPDHAVRLSLHLVSQNGAMQISKLHVNDADALQLDGGLAIDAKGSLTSLKLTDFHASFPAAYARYGQAWLASLGLPDANVTGDLNGSLDLRADGLHAFAFSTPGLDFHDASGSLGINSLNGGLDWVAQGNRPATTLAWSGMQFHRVPLGGAKSQWHSRGGTLAMAEPLLVPVLNGQLRLGNLDIHPAAARGQRLSTSIAVLGVDLGALCHAFGWPAFPGTLAGAIPSLRMVDDHIQLDGGLSANLFDGFVDITSLSLQDPFGADPVLAADVAMRQLDLAAITSVFDFGSITGRLDGSIDGLRLVDWNPVAFKASLLADGGGRISQRAVNNLTSVGGGGVAGGLQGAVLKLFKTFAYKRIGLNCTLHGSVCQMSGLQPTGDGYTIVEGSGLPHLQVIGHQTRVDWPTLVRRLRDAINGAPPEVR